MAQQPDGYTTNITNINVTDNILQYVLKENIQSHNLSFCFKYVNCHDVKENNNCHQNT